MKLGELLILAVLIPTGWIVVSGCSGPAATRIGAPPAPSSAAMPATRPAADAAAAAEVRVNIDNFSFDPPTVTVPAGTAIVWTNRDDVPHTVTSTTHEFRSPAMDTDATFTFRFDRPGTYPYFCAVHPHMTGQVIVK
jgi:plastocyanin